MMISYRFRRPARREKGRKVRKKKKGKKEGRRGVEDLYSFFTPARRKKEKTSVKEKRKKEGKRGEKARSFLANISRLKFLMSGAGL